MVLFLHYETFDVRVWDNPGITAAISNTMQGNNLCITYIADKHNTPRLALSVLCPRVLVSNLLCTSLDSMDKYQG